MFPVPAHVVGATQPSFCGGVGGKNSAFVPLHDDVRWLWCTRGVVSGFGIVVLRCTVLLLSSLSLPNKTRRGNKKTGILSWRTRKRGRDKCVAADSYSAHCTTVSRTAREPM